MMESLVPNTVFEKAVLIDSGALYALVDSSDTHHSNATNLLREAQKRKIPIFITNAVIIEAYRLVLHKKGIPAAHKFIDSIGADIQKGALRLERMAESDESAAKQLVLRYSDQDITLTDAINFCLMFRFGIFQMLGFDSHCLIVGLQHYAV